MRPCDPPPRAGRRPPPPSAPGREGRSRRPPPPAFSEGRSGCPAPPTPYLSRSGAVGPAPGLGEPPPPRRPPPPRPGAGEVASPGCWGSSLEVRSAESSLGRRCVSRHLRLTFFSLDPLLFRLASELSPFAFTSVLKLSLARSSFRPALVILSAGSCAVLNRDLYLSEVASSIRC